MRFTPDAWNWEAARQRCLREARRHTWTEADAQDAVQTAMLQAWRSRASCHTPDDPIPWMLAITRREAWRTRPPAGQVPLDESAWGERASFDEADGLVERLDVQAAIAGLGEAERQLLHLRYVEDLPQPGVAQRLGIPEGTAKVRLHRARNRLRARLSPT
jgi:RNA polymerase sigma-70 factor (ECF subfamily)